MLHSFNPATGEKIATYEPHDDEELAGRLDRAWRGWQEWRHSSFADRATVLTRAADLLEERSDDLARIITEEVGKPITQSRSEVGKCALVCRHYAEHGMDYLALEPVETEASRSYVRFDPLGPVLAVMPWNFPFWQVFRFAAPAVMAGNVGLLKHASNVTGCAIAIEDVFADIGLPDGGFQSLLVGSERVEQIIADPRVRAVTLTGSEGAGSSVASIAGEHLKKTVLELGGSDAFVVLDDADVARAAEVAVASRLINTGQSCIAAKRFIVHTAIAGEFEDAFRAHLEAAVVGDPMDEATTVGPLAREDLLDDLHDQVERTVEEGATLVVGGEVLDRPGYYYAPTMLTGVEPTYTAGCEETFGPVAAIIRVAHEQDAITVANDSSYGLGASVWTQDKERGERVAAQIEAGAVFVNELVKSDPRLPFGGVKRSGYGRELARDGLREFVNIKTVWVA